MKKFLISIWGAVLLVLPTVSTGSDINSPHTNLCITCHMGATGIPPTNLPKNPVELINLCLTCHNPAIMEKALSPKDMANPFGSTTMGVYTSGQKQTSHNWYAPADVPAAGATASATLNGQLPAQFHETVNCVKCHNPHDNANGKYLRVSNDGDKLCLECHGVRNKRNHLTGTHPVFFSYTGVTSKARLKPAEYQSLPVNANPANPTSAMKLTGGQLLCTTCHGVHFTDSNSRTVDSAASSTFGLLSSSEGYLLRTDMRGDNANDLNICTNCHAGKVAHNRKGQNIQCTDCHGGHVDEGDGTRPNVWLVRRYMNYSGGVKLSSYRRPVFNQDIGGLSNFAGDKGVCQACHSVPPPGGSYPAEHASTDPNVCRSCHAHNSKSGSFSADCKGCHGYPPQQNTAGGPLGYASGYASSGFFKDESMTGHLAHAGKAPYTFSCFECHGGNKHATGNYQQLFISTNGTLAATGGAIPSYSTGGAGTCATVYCHSNGAPAGEPAVYKSPSWANAKGSIIGTAGECGACHDASPATNAHSGHLSYGFACSVCHSATVSGSSSIIDISKHVNGTKEVKFSSTATIGGTGAYDNSARTCSNLYCHSNGNQGALVYANPAAWTSGADYDCNGCHGTGNPLGAPDYSNGGAGKFTANSHLAHVKGALGTIICSNCHFTTASSTVTGALAANSQHLSGTVNVVFNPAVAGTNASWDPATGTCANIACHGGAPAQWGSTAACLTCHSVSVRGRAAIGPQFGGNSHHVQGDSITAAHCYQCHWEANSDGTINQSYHNSNTQGGPVDLVIYGAGSRPAQYVVGTTAVQYTAFGSRAEMAKINSHCLGCHSDQNNTTQPFGDGKTPNSYAWDGASIATKYGDTGTTTWGKYSGTNVTPKSTVTKAFSAHGNAAANKGGWDTKETWTDRMASATVLCFDCHNSHGSSVSGTTTSYASATASGGILKDTVAGKGGYTVTYQPKAGGSTAARNAYNPGAGLCFDCHLNAALTSTPWGYNATFGSTQQVMGYWDSAYFSTGTFGSSRRYPYKATLNNWGGHFGASSPMSSIPAHAIGGLCTPCHDPHGVSPTLGANKKYGVPLLKGTWLTSPYKEDVATADNQAYQYMGGGGRRGGDPSSSDQAAYKAATTNSYHIDQNTFSSGTIAETPEQFAGLCLNCHGKATLTNGTNHTWKSKDRIHESVKGWKTANSTKKHSYSCSKCHTVHNARLPRLMVTNCLDYRHRSRVAYNSNPVISGGRDGRRGGGGGHIPGIIDGDGSSWGDGSNWGDSRDGSSSSSPSVCHDNYDSKQQWNVKTPWTTSNVPPGGDTGGGTTTGAPSVPKLVAEPDQTCSSSCPVSLQWNASTNPNAGSTTQYLVQVSTSSSFSTVKYTSGWISGTSWSTSMTSGTTYYWRVQARDAGTTSLVSAWSTADSFKMSSSSWSR